MPGDGEKARRFGNGPAWSEQEDAVMRALYPLLGPRSVRAVLAGRSEKAIQRRAARLGLMDGRRARLGGRLCPARSAAALARLLMVMADPAAELPPVEREAPAPRPAPKRRRRRGGAPAGAGRVEPVRMAAPVVARAVAPRKRMSFEQQLEAVRNGASLERVWRAPSAADARTLGGVASGWGM